VLDLARRVGPTGHVLGLDVSEAMSARARERIAAAGLENAKVVVDDAATYAFPRHDADLVFSRFGVMFFAEPAAAFANLRLAMRPGGRLLGTAWRPLAENPWFIVPLEAARPLLPPQPPPEPHVPGPFAFADAERVRSILRAAGWRSAEIVRHDMPLRLAGAGQLDEATEFATRVGPLARALAEADADLRSRARQAVREALRAWDGPNGISLAGSIWLVAARA
jgi:SAM-dependent methyltransferase